MKLLFVAVLVLVCAGCQQEGFETAHAKAEEAIARAESIGNVWTTSYQLLEAASAAHLDGDEAEAIRSADEARIHAELAIQQAAREAETWQDNVIGE